MADEGRVHAAVAIELFFEREDDQRLVDVVTEKAHASLSPCPELRRHVIHGRNAAPFHLPRHAPVERRRVDDDGEIGPPPVGLADQSSIEPENLREPAENLGDADDGEVFGVDDGLAPGSPHAIAADAEEAKPTLRVRWVLAGRAPQRINQLRPIHLPRSFAR